MKRRSRKRIYFLGARAQIRPMLEPVLSSDNVMLSCFSAPSDCLERLLGTPCDILIVDLEGCETEGMELLLEVRRRAPWISTMALVENGAVPTAVKAITAGACECLEKPLQMDPLCEAVKRLLTRMASLPRSHRALTPMEVRIMRLILAGKTSQDIAAHVGRSKRTIDVRRKNIMRKVRASTLAELVKRALAMDLTEEPSCEEVLEADTQED